MGILEKKMKQCKLLKYKNIHAGKTIIILGSGYGLSRLTDEQINKIENEYISIGCNQSYLKVKSNYYISGHLHHSLMQYHYGGDASTVIFQGEPSDFYETHSYDVDVLTDINVVGDTGYLPMPSENQITNLIGAEQIGFSATHLAYILGASKIIYIGFDFTARGHFYNTDLALMNIMKLNADFIKQKYYNESEFIAEDIDDFYLFNFRHDINKVPFKSSDYIIHKFGSYINTLHENNIPTYTIENCVLNNFGSQIIEL